MGPDWLWVFTFSLGGLAMGMVTTLVGLPKGSELWGWALLHGYFVVAIVILGITHPFWTFLLGSMGAGAAAGLFEASLVRRFHAHNPWYAGLDSASGLRTSMYLLAFSISAGTVLGVFVGGLAWALALL